MSSAIPISGSAELVAIKNSATTFHKRTQNDSRAFSWLFAACLSLLVKHGPVLNNLYTDFKVVERDAGNIVGAIAN